MKDTYFLLKMDKNIKLKLKNLMTNFVTFGSDSYYQGLAKKLYLNLLAFTKIAIRNFIQVQI